MNQANNEIMREVFDGTKILRKPITGIVSDYHELPYILIAPDEERPNCSIEVNGKINVSPKFVISPSMLAETFGDVFDPETFNQDIQGRMFSFAYNRNRNVKVQSEFVTFKNIEETADEYIQRVQDDLLRQENMRTGLILSPRFGYYPVSIDRFINEILDREFRV